MTSEENKPEVMEDISVIAPFDPTKKKKKKKSTTHEFIDENANPLAKEMENLTVSDGTEASFVGLKKKKMKPVDANTFVEDDGEVGEESEDNVNEDNEIDATDLQSQQAQYFWGGSDRDYLYEELLGRVFNVLRENNPELAGDRRRTVMRPPNVMREGTKKTVFANFIDLCRTMHRQPEHVMTYILAELGTSGSLDGQQRLVVKGRFPPKAFEGLLRRYSNEYVFCNSCKSSDTILAKENRIFFLRCEQCGSGRSVSSINKGFVARVGRRAA